jgi:hypothetical protein
VSGERDGARVLGATIDVLERLFVLVRCVALHAAEHDQVRTAADALSQAIAEARPPFALQLLPEAALRDGRPLPLSLELHRRSQQLVGALARWKTAEIAIDALPEPAVLIALARAVLDATHASRGARAPELPHVRLRGLRRPSAIGPAAGEAALDAFVAPQIDRALADIERIAGTAAQGWPWAEGRAVLWRVERCLLAGPAATARSVELALPPWTTARRALAAALYTSAVLGRLQAGLIVQRAAAHAALALGCFGLAPRPGAPLPDAAQSALAAMLPRAGERPAVDPHRLRATALIASAARSGSAAPELPLTALLLAVYELERRRCPPIDGLQLSRSDLHAWLNGALGRELHAGWGRALLEVFGPVPAGTHVLAEGRLGVVLGEAARGDAWRPRVLLGGQASVPSHAVSLHSPLGMTPWAK